MKMRYEPSTGRLYGVKGRVIGALNSDGYLTVQLERKRVKAHRVAWRLFYGEDAAGQIDHINGDRSDNRIENLRLVDNRTNGENRRAAQSNSRSGHLGVSWHAASGKWAASIRVSGKKLHLGLFDCPAEAHQKYLGAKRRHHAGCTI
jgi:hypothetical protein